MTTLRFPPDTSFQRLTTELHRIGYAISARRNADGSHDVVERPMLQTKPITTPVRNLQDLQS
jgi:hypothetical protein